MTAKESSLMEELDALIIKSKKLKASLAVRNRLRRLFDKMLKSFGLPTEILNK